MIPWALESWANSTIDTYVDESMSDPRNMANKEHAIVTMNHPGDLDWMFGWVVINRVGMLGVSPPVLELFNGDWYIPICVMIMVEDAPL